MSIIKKMNEMLNNKDSRRFVANVIGNYAIKGGAMIVSFLVMPAYLNYFQSQALLGMWFTATALLNWIMMFDFGIGGGVRNEIVAPLETGDKKTLKQIFSAAYVSVGAIVLILLVVQHFIVQQVDWFSVLAVSPNEISERTLKLTIHILIIGVCVRFFSVLTTHILYAMQKATLAGLLNLISNILILVYMLIAHPLGNETDLIILAFVQAFSANIPAIIAMVMLFCGKLKGTTPSFRAFQWERAKKILGSGSGLFYLQILITVVFGVKEIFISWFVGPEQVVDYQIYFKLIGIVGSLFALALTPIWSAVTKALVQNKISWVKGLHKKGMQIICLFSIGQLILVFAMPWIAKIWLGVGATTIHWEYGLLFCVYNVLYMWVMMDYQFACGMNRIRAISIGLSVACVLNILFAYFGCKIYPGWITVVVATALAVIPCALLVSVDLKKYINMLEQKNKNSGAECHE